MAETVHTRRGNWAAKESGQHLMRLVSQAQKEKFSAGEKVSPIVDMVNFLIEEAIKRRASDIHIEPQEEDVLIRLRIDGLLKNFEVLPKLIQAPLISRIKVMASMDISERRHPQDGRMKATFCQRRVDLRISVIPALHGEKMVLRLLDVEATSIPLEGIGCSPEIYEKLISLIEKPQGVIFITGPTGSGKTSTLYACLNHVKSENVNITTLEDPIEYEMKGVTQIGINEKIGLTFTDVLRSVLRQDPDVIMVGEMRDAETARIAMQASQTGHLVFSTLHTNDSISAVTRLVDMGTPPYLIGSSVTGVLAQRLVRIICPECKEPYEPTPMEFSRLGISPFQGSNSLYHGKGCASCDFTGFRGRTGIFELFILDEEMRALINSGAPESLLREKAQTKGMTPLREDGVRKIREGVTTITEILRLTIK